MQSQRRNVLPRSGLVTCLFFGVICLGLAGGCGGKKSAKESASGTPSKNDSGSPTTTGGPGDRGTGRSTTQRTTSRPKIDFDILSMSICPDRTHLILCRKVDRKGGDSEESEYVVEKYQLEPFKLVGQVDSEYRASHLSQSADGNFICGDGPNQEIRVWDAHTFEVLAHYRATGFEQFPTRSYLGRDGSYVLSKYFRRYSLIDRETGYSSAVNLQNAVPFDAVCSPTSLEGYLGWIEQTPNGKLAKFYIFDGKNSPADAKTVGLPFQNPDWMDVSADGNMMAITDRGGAVMAVDLVNWKTIGIWDRNEVAEKKSDRFESLSISTEGSFIATIPHYSGRPEVEVWEVSSGTMKIIGPDWCKHAYFVDDTILAINTQRDGLLFYDVTTNQPATPSPPTESIADGNQGDLPGAEPVDLANLTAVEAMQVLRDQRRYDEAVAFARDAAAPSDEVGRESSFIEFHRAVAKCLRFAGDHKTAAEHSQHAFDAARRLVERNPSRYQECLHELSDDLLMAGDVDAAQTLFELNRESLLEQFDEKSYPLAAHDYVHGRFMVTLGDWVSANDRFVTALEAYKYDIKSRWDEVARCMMWVGSTYADLQEYDRAIPLLKEAHETLLSGYERWHPLACESGIRYKMTLMSMRDFEAAERLEIRVPQLEEIDHESSIYSLTWLASNLAAIKNTNQAESIARQVEKAIVKVYGPHHRSLAVFYADLGFNYLEAYMYELAESKLVKALEQFDQLYGRSHSQRPELLLLLAKSQAGQNNRDEAMINCREAVELSKGPSIRERELAVRTRYELAPLLLLASNTPEALAVYDEMMQELRETINVGIRLLPDRLRHRYAGGFKQYIQRPISAAMDRRFEQAWVDRSAEWVINMKGLAADRIAEELLFLKGGEGEEIERLRQQLQVTRKRLSTYGNSNISPRHVSPSGDELRQLMDDEAKITAEISRLVNRDVKETKWISLAELRTAIPAGSVVIEMMRYRRHDDRTSAAFDEHYAAWVIPASGEGKVRLIPLGACARIDELTQRYLDKMEEPVFELSKESTAAAFTEIYPLAVLLSLRALQPMGSALAAHPRWIFCPDGNTWRIPWSGLIDVDGKYVAETRVVSCLYSSRMLTKEHGSESAELPMILANPDYNAGAPANTLPFPYGPLPGTEREANAIKVPISKIAGATVEPLMGEMAKESSLKGTKAPSLIAISTHGYFEERNGLLDPLIRCGVALAGANLAYRESMRSPDTWANTDGILTGIEAATLDLNGTQLVFLNACETGQGMAVHGEGMAGLHQAFHLAGTRQVISTLWPIADQQSADLASYFFNELSEGEPPDEALRIAQAKLIEDLKAKYVYAHPRYFAPFQITGVPSKASANAALMETNVVVNSLDMPLLHIEADAFTMGSPREEPGRVAIEGQHEVTLSKDYWIGRFEVTQDEYEFVMGINPAQFRDRGAHYDRVGTSDTRRFPVENVSYLEAVEFCEALSNLPAEKEAGRRYRLPTEAEWEYACRGGSESAYYFGSAMHSHWANIDGSQPTEGAPTGPVRRRPTIVGEFPWNGFGLHDTHGNVWEWCGDWYAFYPTNSITDPTGPLSGEKRVLRGGGFNSPAQAVRSALRNAEPEHYRSPNLGFRIVCEMNRQ